MQHVENIVYLIAASLFIFGLKQLGSPKTAARGNFLAAIGMLLAIIAVLVGLHASNAALILIFAALVVGSAIGAVAAQRVQMTAMPQMVALFNGLGGAASAFVARPLASFVEVGDPATLATFVTASTGAFDARRAASL